jgi:hypothetical protein
MTYEVRYQIGTYSGVVTVNASDDDQAIAIAKSRVRRESSLTLAYESYKVIRAY